MQCSRSPSGYQSLRWVHVAVVYALLALCMPPVVEGRTVYVFRHCVRAVSTDWLQGYANSSFPEWGVGHGECLPRGLKIFEGLGAHLRPALNTPLKIVADNVTRNIDSAKALASGLGVNSSSVVVDTSPYYRCPAPPAQEELELITHRLQSVPKPQGYSQMLAQFDEVLGGWRHIAEVPDKVDTSGRWGPSLTGHTALASGVADTWLMQLGGGLQAAWGRLSAAAIYRLLQATVYDWAVTRRSQTIERATSSQMLATILADLGAAGDASTVLLGHDTDINGVGTLLDLGWSAPPFPDNATVPSAALKFETSATRVSVHFVYTSLDSDAGEVLQTPVLNTTIADFCARAVRAVDWSCVRGSFAGGLCKHLMAEGVHNLAVEKTGNAAASAALARPDRPSPTASMLGLRGPSIAPQEPARHPPRRPPPEGEWCCRVVPGQGPVCIDVGGFMCPPHHRYVSQTACQQGCAHAENDLESSERNYVKAE